MSAEIFKLSGMAFHRAGLPVGGLLVLNSGGLLIMLKNQSLFILQMFQWQTFISIKLTLTFGIDSILTIAAFTRKRAAERTSIL